MDLHRFRRNPSGLLPRMSAPGAAPTAVTSPPAFRPMRHSAGAIPTSPQAFHRLSTPSPTRHDQDLASPMSVFTVFSRAPSSTYRVPEDHIIEVDDTPSSQRLPSQRYSTSPSNHAVLSPRKTSSSVFASARRNNAFDDSRRRSSVQYSVGGTPSRLSGKWEPTPWYRLGWYGRWSPRRSHVRRLCFWCGAVGLFVFCFSLVFVLPTDLQRLAPVVIGALLSFISALTILVSFFLQPQNRRYPNELLVYVAMCEFGLAVLALTRVMTYCSDTSYNCKALAMLPCRVTTGLEMFLLLASVGWFGCAILHLFVSVSNPFANYKSQLKRYHLTVWGGSILVSVIAPLIVFSERSQKRFDLSSVEICRAVSLNFPLLPAFSNDDDRATRMGQWQTLNMEFWGPLVALVVLLVIAAQFILALGWWRSNSGTVIALKARRRMMKRMTTYVHTLNATWLLILVVFFTYRSNPAALRHLAEISTVAAAQAPSFTPVDMNILDAFFHFLLAAKGYFTCVVWLAVNRNCCALARPVLCKDPMAPARRDSVDDASLSSDDDDDSDNEDGGRFSLAHLASRQSQATAGLPSTASASRRSAYTPTSRSFANTSMLGAPSLTASFASQNNETLQREIIYYTVCGITKSIVKSSQNPDTDVFFQQLLVGADRESTQVEHVDLHADASPMAYCQAAANDLSLTSTANVDNSMVSSAGPNLSFVASLHSVRERCDSNDDANDGNVSCHSFSSNASVSVPSRQQRFSMYPVSHVPFELFEQEIELQSHRSSEASLSLSPIFANLRRTAHAIYGSNAKGGDAGSSSARASASVEHPRPKMFIDYAPTEFRAIRRAFGLSDEMYLASFRSTAKERVSAGSSGAFMFFSGDNSLIVKSMKEKECRKLVDMVPAYADYIMANPQSRIIRFFGCHRLRLYGRNFFFVVMSNVLHSPVHTPTITEKYDVKGSWIDRQAKLPQPGDVVTCSECNAPYEFGLGDASTTYPFHVHRPDTVLKDLDLTRPLLMGRRVARELYDQIERDSAFLHSMGIMDYSLLVGVHKCSHPTTDDSWRGEFATSISFLAAGGSDVRDDVSDDASGCGAHLEPIPEASDDPEEVYFIGIIDILQEWNWEKQLEKVGKTLIGKSSSGISAVAPDAYCQRFQSRVAQVLGLSPDEDDRETKRLVKKLSMHLSTSSPLDELAFQIRDSFTNGSNAQDEEEADEHEGDVNVVRDSFLDDAIQFDAEAMAVSIDLDDSRMSQ